MGNILKSIDKPPTVSYYRGTTIKRIGVKTMGLRDKIANVKPKTVVVQQPVTYQTVLGWMLGLSNDEYAKMLKVLSIYREADGKVLGLFGLKEITKTKIFESGTEVFIDDKLDQLLLRDAVQSSVPGMDYELTPKKHRKPVAKAK